MAAVLQPWQIPVAAVAGWITRQQDAIIEYLKEENRILKQQLGGRRLRLTDAQRKRLAVRGKAIGRQALAEIASLAWRTAPGYQTRQRGPGRTNHGSLSG